jgi:hypothetical protein
MNPLADKPPRPLLLMCWHGDLEHDRGGGNTLAIDRLRHFIGAGWEVHLLSRTAPTCELVQGCEEVWQFQDSAYRQMRRYLYRGLSESRVGRMLLSLGFRQATRFHQLFLNEKRDYHEAVGRANDAKREGPVPSFRKRRNASLIGAAEQLIRFLNPDAVFASFAWNTVIFDACPEHMLTILDTHDIQHRRAKVAAASGGDLSDRDCSHDEEAEELRKADLLIGIQQDETALLHDMCPDAITVTTGHVPPRTEAVGSPEDSRNLLFIANYYNPNTRGLKAFLEQDWPALHEAGATLTVIGKVCTDFTQDVDGAAFLGPVDDLDEYYAQAAVVLNLASYGTGLPIKTVEALAAGKVVLTRHTCCEGLPDDAPVIQFEPGQAAQSIQHLLTDVGARREQEQAAVHFAATALSDEAVYGELDARLEDALTTALLPAASA